MGVNKRIEKIRKNQEEKIRMLEKVEMERQKKIDKNFEELEDYEEPDWAKIDDIDDDVDSNDEDDEISITDNNDSKKKNSNKKKKKEAVVESVDDIINGLYCKACKKKYKNENQMEDHIRSKKHKQMVNKMKK